MSKKRTNIKLSKAGSLTEPLTPLTLGLKDSV